MSVLESHSCPPRDHEIRRPQKVTNIDLPCFNSHLKIEEQGNRSVSDYAEEFYHLSSQIDLTKFESYMISRFKILFYKLNDIVMAVEHAEALLEKGKNQNLKF
ncbi:unnamed protein product [Spirodela intermedia]|uniref:Retrotransposon gag domain-containing protein n=1 Tax=Spirodela intermedia TaxID=51605 RepID=A0ABN7EA89_SPIIN|nr:unnamed protein product [Spirodela intermedia]